MAVSSSTAKVQYTANGSTTDFTVTFYFLANSHLVVIDTNLTTGVETVKTLTTDYTVTGAGVVTGGTVTMLSAPTSGHRLTIYRSVPQTQTTDYVADDAFDADTTEADFDKLCMEVQQLQDQTNRCLQFSRSEVTSVSGATISLPAVRASTVLGFDALGALELITQDSASAVAAAASAAAAAASASTASTSATSAASSAASASAIASGVLTTKGDLVSYSTVIARLAVGSNTQVLTADSTQTLGVKWATPATWAAGSPASTKGDILGYSTVNARVPVGSDGQVLTADSSQALGVAWATPTGVPTGTILDYGASAAPTGYLACDGSAVSRATYSALFAIISTTWGVGNGTTTFNVPDLRGRASIGSGTGSGLTARTLAATGGEETHALIEAELAAHTHTTSYGTTTGTASNSTARGDGPAGTIATSSTGSGTAHNTMMPFAVVTKIIKT